MEGPGNKRKYQLMSLLKKKKASLAGEKVVSYMYNKKVATTSQGLHFFLL